MNGTCIWLETGLVPVQKLSQFDHSMDSSIFWHQRSSLLEAIYIPGSNMAPCSSSFTSTAAASPSTCTTTGRYGHVGLGSIYFFALSFRVSMKASTSSTAVLSCSAVIRNLSLALAISTTTVGLTSSFNHRSISKEVFVNVHGIKLSKSGWNIRLYLYLFSVRILQTPVYFQQSFSGIWHQNLAQAPWPFLLWPFN